jgi:hypothetical protein
VLLIPWIPVEPFFLVAKQIVAPRILAEYENRAAVNPCRSLDHLVGAGEQRR